MRCGHRRAAEETQCTFAANHQVGDDIEGVLEANERQDVEAGYVLDRVFVAYAGRPVRIGQDQLADVLDFFQEFGMGLGEALAALGVAGVKNCAVGQDDSRRFEDAVAVGVRAAVHARGIIYDDAAHHGRLFRGGVGGEHTAVGGQNLADARADDARLQGDVFGIGRHLIAFPRLSGHHQDRIGDCLARKRRAGGTERHGHADARGSLQQTRDLGLVVGAHNDFGYEPVEAGVGTPGEQAQLVGVDSVAVDKLFDFVQKFLMER